MADRNLELALRLKAAVEGLQQVQALIGEIQQLGGSTGEASTTAATLASELNRIADQPEVVDQIRKLQAELQDQKEAATQAAHKASDLAAAYQRLGVTSQAALDGAAAEMRQAFSTLQSSGTATARELDQAFERVAASELRAAEAAGAARQTTVAYALRAEAATDVQRRSVERLIASLNQSGAAGARAGAQVAAGARTAEASLDRANRSADRLGGGLRGIVQGALAFAGVNIGADMVGDLAGIADEVRNVENRLRLVTNSTEEFDAVQRRLFQTAQTARSAYASTADVYTRLSRSTEELGISNERLLGVTESIAKAGQIGGASTESFNAALIQLGQGLGAGALRGEEFNSVMEQAPRLAEAIADGLDVPIGKLRQMADAGELTTARLIEALESQAEAIEREFAQLSPTIDSAVTRLRNTFGQYVKELDNSKGITQTTVALLGQLGEHLDEIAALAAAAGEALFLAFATRGALAIRQYIANASTAVATTGALTTAVQGLSKAATVVPYLLLAQQVGEFLSVYAEAQAAALQAAEAQRKVREELQAQADAAGDAALALAGAGAAIESTLGAVAGKTADLTETQRQYYAAMLADQEAFLRAEIARGVREQELHGRTLVNLGEAGEQLRAVRAAREELQASIDASKPLSADQVVDPASLQQLQAAIDSFRPLDADDLVDDEALKRVDDAKKSLAELSAVQLEGLRQSAQRNLAAVNAELDSAAAKFPALSDSARAAVLAMDPYYGQLIRLQQDLGAAVDGLTTQTFARFGVDVEAVLTGVDAKSRDLLTTFRNLVNDPQSDPRLITAAFNELLATLDSPEELDSLQAALGYTKLVGVDAAELIKAKMLELDPVYSKQVEQLRQIAEAAEARYQREVSAARQWREDLQTQAATITEIQAQIGDAGTLSRLDQLRAALTSAYLAGKVAAEDYRGSLDAIAAKEDEIVRNQSGAASAIAGYVTTIRQSYAALSDEAAAAFDHINSAAQISGGSVSNYLSRLNAGISALSRIYTDQTSAADRLIESLNSVDGATAGTIRRAEQARASMDYLDEARLDALSAAIDGANSRLTSLRDNASATVASLQDELDRLQGNQDAIEQRRRDAQRSEIEAQLEQAQALRDSDTERQLREALQLLDEIERAADAELRASTTESTSEPEPPRQTNPSASSQQQTVQAPPTSASTPSRASAETITVRFIVGSAAPVDSLFEPSEAERFIRELERAAGVSIVN